MRQSAQVDDLRDARGIHCLYEPLRRDIGDLRLEMPVEVDHRMRSARHGLPWHHQNGFWLRAAEADVRTEQDCHAVAEAVQTEDALVGIALGKFPRT